MIKVARKKIPMKKITGFTLLESLLVVVIVAAIATFGFATFRHLSEDFKVNRTVLQIQQLLQAGSTYYVNNNCWPNANECKQPVSDFTAYIPIATAQNPWGNSYRYQETLDALKFQVLANGIPNLLANRIVNRLPNAIVQNCTAKNCSILAEIPIPAPAASSPETNFLIRAINSSVVNLSGDTKHAQTWSPNFTCPDGWIALAVPIITQISTNDNPANQMLCGNVAKLDIGLIQTDAKCFAQKQGFACQANISANATVAQKNWTGCKVDYSNTQGLGTIAVTTLSYCCKPNANGFCAAS